MSLAQTKLCLFEYVKAKEGNLNVLDLLANDKLQVFERRCVMGMEPGDIYEGRLVPDAVALISTESFAFRPRAALDCQNSHGIPQDRP